MPFYYEHYKPQNYQHYPQNWAIVQDERGVIYVANVDGVLEYDGTRWQLIATTMNSVVRSLALGPDGSVYVGMNGDFGYLAPDSSGTLQYISLLDEVNSEDRDFADVWATHATREGVYFQTKDRLFRWDGKDLKMWESETSFHTSFVVYDRFYVREKGAGLFQLADGVLQPVPGGEYFADLRIFMMLPYGEDRLLIGTGKAGFFIYDHGVLAPFPTEAAAILEEFMLYHGCVLPGGLYALATLGGGSLILDQQGRLVQRLNKDAGFPDDWVNYVYADAQGGLWMALDATGIARVDVASQLTKYDDQRDFHGNVYAVSRYQDTLYVGTSTGLFKLHRPAPEADHAASFVEILSGKPTPDLLATDSILFAATHDGLYGLRRDSQMALLSETRVFALLDSKHEPGHIFVGKKDGLARLRHTGTRWELQSLYRGKASSDEIKGLVEEADGTLWLRAGDGTVVRVRFVDGRERLTSKRFSARDGLPEDLREITAIDDEVFFVAKQGVYRFDPDGNEGALFQQDTTFFKVDPESSAPLRNFVQGRDGNVWSVQGDNVDIATLQADGSYTYQSPTVLRFPKSTAVYVHAEEDGIAWIGNGNQLVRYDPRIERDYTTGFSALLRRIVATRTERVLYGGAPVAEAVTLPTLLNHADNDLRFEVGAPSYHDVQANRYQYYMEGVDQGWSDWTTDPNRTYNDLGGGRYTLRVRVRDAQGSLSEEAVFAFRVLPPWYRTWWAYLLYLVSVLAAIAFSGHHYRIVQENKRAQEQARELERERELNQRLQEANESLVQANRLKDEFLANTSHELRTPLTAILGFTQILKDELPDTFLELLDPIESNGERLLHTLNSLLEVARLRAGTLELERRPVNVGDQAAEVLRLLAPLAQQGALSLDLERPPAPLFANLDRHCFEQILNNLVGNAIKFTEAGGVTVRVEQQDERVCVHVRDTGIGIDESFIPLLFEEFKQESTGLARSHEGNGLGLAITARLVELMDGEIVVQSEKGKGSVFTVSFPLYYAGRDAASEDRPAQRLGSEQHPGVVQSLNGSTG